MRGLLVFGGVLAMAAIVVKAGLRDESVPGDVGKAVRGQQVAADDDTKGDQDMLFGSSKTKGAHGAVEHANDTNFREKVLEVEGRVLVDFYADWCGPCRMIAPLLEELAAEMPGARIVKVNVDESPGLARYFQIESIPALIAFEDGRPVDQHVGMASKSALRDMLTP